MIQVLKSQISEILNLISFRMEKSQTVKQIGGFKVVNELGKGSFGTVYKAIKIQEQQVECQKQKFYAIKVQSIGAVKPMLHLQYDILKILRKKLLDQSSTEKGYSIPQVLLYYQEEYFSYMVMQILDTTLQDFANKEIKNILPKDCLIRIFYCILKIVQNLHKLGFTHRDIKPSNFMLKIKKDTNHTISVNQKYQSTIYPIDLGLCKNYINPITRQHIACKQNKKMVGTAIFCSLNTHQGIEQSRRDDLQSIIYLVTYLVKKLPWEIVANKEVNKAQEDQKQISSPRKVANMKYKLDLYDQIYQIKNSIDFDKFLKDPQFLPVCFLEIYKYIRKLSFQQEPNYEYLSDLLDKEHLQLTECNLSSISYQCIWKSLSLQQNNKILQGQTEKKKKIKINFKIPPNKLKKPQHQVLNQNNILPQNS